MNFKKFFWPTKEKIIFSAAIFVLFNIFLIPAIADICAIISGEADYLGVDIICPKPYLKFTNILRYLEDKSIISINFLFEFVYVIVSYLVSTIIVYFKNFY